MGAARDGCKVFEHDMETNEMRSAFSSDVFPSSKLTKSGKFNPFDLTKEDTQ
jgi:hypothetical protein